MREVLIIRLSVQVLSHGLTEGFSSRSAATRTPSTNSASSAARSAPATTCGVLYVLNPAVMIRPRPPWPTIEAIVAVATTWTAADLSPVMSRG